MNLKKTALAAGIALGLGTAGSASALTVSVTSMNFFGPRGAIGTLNSTATGGFGAMTSASTFFGKHWTASGVQFYDTHSSQLTFAGTNPLGPWNMTFHLTGNEIAWGTLFDWSTSSGIAVLAIMDCAPGATGSACVGTGTPMQNGPFIGSAPAFSGILATGTVPFSGVVPVPAAVWLFGSGLVGLAGVARRRKKAA